MHRERCSPAGEFSQWSRMGQEAPKLQFPRGNIAAFPNQNCWPNVFGWNFLVFRQKKRKENYSIFGFFFLNEKSKLSSESKYFFLPHTHRGTKLSQKPNFLLKNCFDGKFSAMSSADNSDFSKLE